jgi:hypothetical protein
MYVPVKSPCVATGRTPPLTSLPSAPYQDLAYTVNKRSGVVIRITISIEITAFISDWNQSFSSRAPFYGHLSFAVSITGMDLAVRTASAPLE